MNIRINDYAGFRARGTAVEPYIEDLSSADPDAREGAIRNLTRCVKKTNRDEDDPLIVGIVGELAMQAFADSEPNGRIVAASKLQELGEHVPMALAANLHRLEAALKSADNPQLARKLVAVLEVYAIEAEDGAARSVVRVLQELATTDEQSVRERIMAAFVEMTKAGIPEVSLVVDELRPIIGDESADTNLRAHAAFVVTVVETLVREREDSAFVTRVRDRLPDEAAHEFDRLHEQVARSVA